MTNKLKFCFLFLLIVGLATVRGQYTAFQTYCQHWFLSDPVAYSQAEHSNDLIDDQLTIGFYPETAVHYHRNATRSVGYVTINNQGINPTRSALPQGVFVKDMEQNEFSDMVYFCGTQWNLVGIIGHFKVNSDGTIGNLYYQLVPETTTLTKLVSFTTQNPQIVAYGIDAVTGGYDLVIADMTISIGSIYQVAPLNHNSVPFDIVCTDDYVAILSNNSDKDNLYIRRLLKSNLSDNIRDYIYEYSVNDTMQSGPIVTFLGCKYLKNNENLIAVVYMTQSTSQWSTALKTFDLATMNMTGSQRHDMYEKNDIVGITYLTGKNKLVVMEYFEPSYTIQQTSAVFMLPFNTTNYTADIFFTLDSGSFYSVDRLYGSGFTVNHFVAGNSYMTGNALWVQTPNKDYNNNCIEETIIDITLENPVDYKAFDNPINPIQHVQSLVAVSHTTEYLSVGYECKYIGQ